MDKNTMGNIDNEEVFEEAIEAEMQDMETNDTLPEDQNDMIQDEDVQVTYDDAWNMDEEELIDRIQQNNESDDDLSIDEQMQEQGVDERGNPIDNNINQPSQEGVVITRPLNYKGRQIPIESEDEAIALMQKGFAFEQKMARLKPYMQYIKAIEDGDISIDDIQALKDLKSGNKEAIAYFANKYNIDPLEISGESNYKPEIPAYDEVKEFFEDYAQQRPDIAGKVTQIFDQLDEGFKAEIYKPDIFPAFVASVESGEFDNVYPYALKIKAVNPAVSYLEAYQYAYQKLINSGKLNNNNTKQPPVENKPKQQKRKKKISYDDIWDNDEYYKELEKKFMI